MAVNFRRGAQTIAIYGRTYDHRTLFKSLGGRFNGENKSWQVPNTDENYERIADLARTSGGIELPRIEAEKKEPNVPRPATVEQPTSITIAQLLERVDTNLRELFPLPLWVVGEVQNLAKKQNYFFQLAEPKEGTNQTLTVRAVIWREQVKQICERHGDDWLQDGLKVRCQCHVQLYREQGALSLNILDIDPSYTRGELAIAREALLRKIRAAGKDSLNKNLSLPRIPRTIGLITADKSRAYSDFCHQLATLHVPVKVIFRATPMQGEEVLKEVPRAIAELCECCEVIVLTRGGGSASDLRWFDAEEVAEAIIGASVPVIAAIGHHDDLCVAEEVCYLRQKTPTAAADQFAEIFAEIETFLLGLTQNLREVLETRKQLAESLYLRMKDGLEREAWLCLRKGQERLARLGEEITSVTRAGIYRRNVVLAELRTKILQSADALLAKRLRELHELEKNLIIKDLRPWLQKGWVKISNVRGKIKSVRQMQTGEHVTAELIDGRVKMQVIDVYKTRKQEQEQTDER